VKRKWKSIRSTSLLTSKSGGAWIHLPVVVVAHGYTR
jgi:hypothetical protein